MVMFAVESALMHNIVGWADNTPSMAAFETALVIRSSIYSNLKKGAHILSNISNCYILSP